MSSLLTCKFLKKTQRAYNSLFSPVYVTLEPCPMCGWAILQSRIRTVYFGSYDVNYGAFSSKIDLRKFSNNQNLKVYGGILEDECNNLLNEFFKALRKL